jgi:hypothetical protein
VQFARDTLKAAGFTIAGNPIKSDAEKSADSARKESDAVNAAVLEQAAPGASLEELVEARDRIARERAERRKVEAIPDCIIALAKAMDGMADALTTMEEHYYAGGAAWESLPPSVGAVFGAMVEHRDSIAERAAEIVKARKDAAEQRKAQKQAEAQLKADKSKQQQIKAAA